MEHLPVIFVFLGLYFWLLVAAASGVIFYCLDNEKGIFATVTAIVAVAAMVVFGDGRLPSYVMEHPGHLIGFILAYFAAGGLWSLAKWYLFASKKRDAYDDVKRKFLLERGVQTADVPEQHKADFRDHLLGNSDWSDTVKVLEKKPDGTTTRVTKSVVKIKPIAWEHKTRIITWMTYWPWSLLWSLLDDIVRNVFRRIQRSLENLMDYIASLVFRGVDKDFTVQGQPNEKVHPEPNYNNNNNRNSYYGN